MKYSCGFLKTFYWVLLFFLLICYTYLLISIEWML